MNKKMLQEFIEKMQEYVSSDDPESAHIDADHLLCELLTKLGYENLVQKYDEVTKWYA